MKLSILPLVATTTLMTGCVSLTVPGGFSPVQGPLARQNPLPQYSAKMSCQGLRREQPIESCCNLRVDLLVERGFQQSENLGVTTTSRSRPLVHKNQC